MNIICKNCNYNFKGKYCNNCGQTADTHRLDFHYLWHQFKHGLLHFDDGILYSGIELFTRPGHSIREFVNGKRVGYFSFVTLLLLILGISHFLSEYAQVKISDLDIEYGGLYANGKTILSF